MGGAVTGILVAGVGNVFLGDDGFGVEVVHRIDPAVLPDGVDVVDYGIRGVHLAYELLDGRYSTVVMIDAVPLEGPPGSLAVLEVDTDQFEPDGAVVESHSMSPAVVLTVLRALGGSVERVLVVGCRPAVLEERMELSEAVASAVDPAARLVIDLVTELAAQRNPAEVA